MGELGPLDAKQTAKQVIVESVTLNRRSLSQEHLAAAVELEMNSGSVAITLGT